MSIDIDTDNPAEVIEFTPPLRDNSQSPILSDLKLSRTNSTLNSQTHPPHATYAADPNQVRHLSPVSNQVRHLSPVSRQGRHLSPVSRQGRHLSPVSRQGRHLSPVSIQRRHLSPVSRQERQISPASAIPRDRYPPTYRRPSPVDPRQNKRPAYHQPPPRNFTHHDPRQTQNGRSSPRRMSVYSNNRDFMDDDIKIYSEKDVAYLKREIQRLHERINYTDSKTLRSESDIQRSIEHAVAQSQTKIRRHLQDHHRALVDRYMHMDQKADSIMRQIDISNTRRNQVIRLIKEIEDIIADSVTPFSAKQPSFPKPHYQNSSTSSTYSHHEQPSPNRSFPSSNRSFMQQPNTGLNQLPPHHFSLSESYPHSARNNSFTRNDTFARRDSLLHNDSFARRDSMLHNGSFPAPNNTALVNDLLPHAGHSLDHPITPADVSPILRQASCEPPPFKRARANSYVHNEPSYTYDRSMTRTRSIGPDVYREFCLN